MYSLRCPSGRRPTPVVGSRREGRSYETNGETAKKWTDVIRVSLTVQGTRMTQMTRISPETILQLGSAFWGSKTLLSAIELGLFTRLAARGPLSLEGVREDLGLHERSARDFLGAMTGLSLPTARAIAAAFPWREHRTFADVGCAQGGLTVEIARAHPHLIGVGFDLPAVRPVFDRYVAKHGLDRRVTFQAGDFFREGLPSVDVLVMGHILHDWSLEEKKLLLRKAYDALLSGGALIVYDAMIDDERRTNAFGLLMSLNMLIETPAGFDYTGADCRGWMQEAGFNDVRIEPLQGPYSMAVGQ